MKFAYPYVVGVSSVQGILTIEEGNAPSDEGNAPSDEGNAPSDAVILALGGVHCACTCKGFARCVCIGGGKQKLLCIEACDTS